MPVHAMNGRVRRSVARSRPTDGCPPTRLADRQGENCPPPGQVWRTLAGAVSGSEIGMGAASACQRRSGAVCVAERRSLTCIDACQRTLRTSACPVRDEVLIRPIAPMHADACCLHAFCAEYVSKSSTRWDCGPAQSRVACPFTRRLPCLPNCTVVRIVRDSRLSRPRAINLAAGEVPGSHRPSLDWILEGRNRCPPPVLLQSACGSQVGSHHPPTSGHTKPA